MSLFNVYMSTLLFVKGMPMMRRQLMTKRRLDGSTFMGMYSGIQSTSHYLQLHLVLAPSYLLCKYAFVEVCLLQGLTKLGLFLMFVVKQSGNFVFVHMFSVRLSFSCLH
jgi:hypothetical protein